MKSSQLNLSHLAAMALAIAGTVGAALPAAAQTVLTFGNERNDVAIQNYFNGGNDAYPADGIGPADGVVFSASAVTLKNAAASGTGKFENNPSGANGVLYFAYSTATPLDTMNVAGGFTSLSFDYSLLNNSSSYDATVTLWSGLNGTGAALGTLNLTPGANPLTCTNCHDEFCTWSAATTGTTNFGTAESVTFGTNSTAPYTEFDAVAFQPAVQPAPLPAAVTLMAGGLLLLAASAWRRRIG